MLNDKVKEYVNIFEREITKVLSTLNIEDSIYFLKILNEKLKSI